MLFMIKNVWLITVILILSLYVISVAYVVIYGVVSYLEIVFLLSGTRTWQYETVIEMGILFIFSHV